MQIDSMKRMEALEKRIMGLEKQLQEKQPKR